MRMFERLRLGFGYLPIKPQKESKARREQADVAAAMAHVPAADSVCCGHCSGNADAPAPDLPNLP
jgi:hypothetical protein